ncbi:hypothetical protein ACHAW6_001262 [Cyclotella cf. meneghiniana]
MAQMQKQLMWNKGIKKSNPVYAQAINNMPSFAITSEEAYKMALSHVLTQYDELFSFCANKAFRKWRFKTYVYSRVALTKLCKRLTDGKKTCIGIGDWSRQDGLKRHPTVPVKKFRRSFDIMQKL